MGLDKLLNGKQVVAVVCNQFGDTGKGKFSDYFASDWANVVARGTGGANAGHTVVVNGQERIFHLLPAGITQDSRAVVTILGNGMVIEPGQFFSELRELDAGGMSYNNLMISKDAHVVTPFHIEFDQAKNKSQAGGGVGSTGRGIGPCYTDKIARRGIMMGDLLDRDKLAKKVYKLVDVYPLSRFRADDVISQLAEHGRRLGDFNICDSDEEIRGDIKEGKRVLLEGAQGLLLSIQHGTYPYVTSSDCSVDGTAIGCGLSPRAVDLTIGVVKFPFMTRVGGGPFPTELGGEESERYCAREEGNKMRDELAEFGIPFREEDGKIKYDCFDERITKLINSSSPFKQGIGLRLRAREYGATTGRPRRTGWTDAVALKYAVGINGPVLALTKVDCVSGVDFSICDSYTRDNNSVGFSKDSEFLRGVHATQIMYPHFGEDLSGARSYEDLPETLRKSIDTLERISGGRAAIISVGADRDATIVR